MTRYDIAKFYGYNSPEEYDEAEKCNHELYAESLKRQKLNTEKESVKHGHWEDCSNGWMCSCCERDNTKDTLFCPNCGAKMDGDRMTKYSKREVLKHLDALMICVGNAYDTSHYLLESDMKFIEKQEKIIKELLEEMGK